MTRVKICGLTTAADRDAAVAAGADAVGFLVGVPVDTERAITPERAADLIAGVPPFVTTVLVTMPASADRALALLDRTGAAAIQIHNDLAVDDVRTVSRESDASVIKAIDADLDAAEQYAPVADALLVDARTAEGAGGTGRHSDWTRAAAVREHLDRPVVLAGGLGPDSVAEAITAVEPFAVDVSSGVEHCEGRKDHAAVRAFVTAAKRQPVSP